MRLSLFNRLALAGIDFNVLHHFVREWSFGEAQVDSLIKQHHGDPLNWFSGQDDPKIWEGIREFSW